MSHRFGNSAKRFGCIANKRGEKFVVIIGIPARCAQLQSTKKLSGYKTTSRGTNNRKPPYAEKVKSYIRGLVVYSSDVL